MPFNIISILHNINYSAKYDNLNLYKKGVFICIIIYKNVILN
jgi:hypothetical protein